MAALVDRASGRKSGQDASWSTALIEPCESSGVQEQCGFLEGSQTDVELPLMRSSRT